MVDEKDEAAEGEQESKPEKKKGMLLIIIIAVSALVLAAGAFFLVPKFMGGKAEKKQEVKAEDSVMFSLEPFVVNLNDPSGTRFLKLSIQLELAGPAIMEKAKTKVPHIRDSVITLLTSKGSDMLMSPEGKLQLKDEINIRANQILGQNSVKNVFFTEFVMQ